MVGGKPTQQKYSMVLVIGVIIFFFLPKIVVSNVLYVITFFAFGVTSFPCALLRYLLCTAEYLPPGYM